MDRRWVKRFKLLVCMVAGLCILSCASVHEVQVLYKLPAPGKALEGKGVRFTLVDERSDKNFLLMGARKELGHFSNNIGFAVAKYGEQGFKIGPFAPLDAIREAFKRRLEDEGIRLESGSGKEVPRLEIALKEFSLDFVDRKWVASMTYEARLKVDGVVRATQFISGNAERVKVVRNKGADMAVGDIFTDALNRLDLVKLFRDARLL